MAEQQNINLTHRLFEKVLNQENVARCEELVANH